jgi:hypothetical protein
MAQNRVTAKETAKQDAAGAADKMAGVHITAMTKLLERGEAAAWSFPGQSRT